MSTRVGEDEAARIDRQIVPDGVEVRDHRLLGDHRHRTGVVDQVGKTLSAQQRAERYDHDPGAGRHLVEVEDLQAIRQDGCDLVALADLQPLQDVGESIDPLIQIVEGKALFAEHDGRFVRVVAGMAGQEAIERHQPGSSALPVPPPVTSDANRCLPSLMRKRRICQVPTMP